jgi:arginyl-tRNA synthetase
MKSREGKVVDADDLIEEIEKLATQEICRRNVENPLAEQELKIRKKIIGQGAIKFYLLRVKAMQDIHFDPQESISFDGFTGPYCQYAYARISGILRNAVDLGLTAEYNDKILLGNEEELQLISHLIRFPEELEIAVNDLTPSRLAVHVFNTAKTFNQFYNKHQVIHAETKEMAKARLLLIKAAGVALKTGLNLLGIDILERM